MSDKAESGSSIVWAVIGVVLILVAGGVGWVWYQYRYLEGVAQQNARDQEIAQRRATCTKIAATPWVEARRALTANEPSAVAAWTEKCSKLSGVIEEVARDGSYMLIAADAETADLSCAPVNRELASKLARGQSITVWGFGQPKRGPRYELRECEWAP